MPARLPQLDRLFLTDGGLETDLMFNRGIELPFFSAVMLLRTEEGREALDEYFRSYLDLARLYEERDVRQGHVEESNVSSVSSLVEMITVQRAYASVQKAMTTLDSARGLMTNEIGKPV